MENNIVMFNPDLENGMYTSLDLGTKEGKAKAMKAMSRCDYSLSKMVNKEVVVKDIFLQPVAVKDKETGEVRELIRTVLFDPEGKSYYSLSTGFFRQVKLLLSIYEQPSEWEEPITISIRQEELPDGKRTLSFDVL